jgi:DNA-binding beta-propeller fold protein YncE
MSLASLPQTLLATRACADKVLAINEVGAITKFADLPWTGKCLSRDVVVSPGFGGFRRDAVFVVQKQTIYRIPPTGGKARAFVNIPSLPNSETSLTFDTVGTFGYNLIATDRLGPIWSINSNGVATQIADVGHHIEGAQVAPLGFAPFGGKLLATNDFTDSVFAVDQDGMETSVATYEQPESVEFVPSVCEFGDSGGALFVASQFGDVIYKFPASDFAAINDGLHALVMTKTGKIGLLSTDGQSIIVSDFQADPLVGELEDSTFFPCSA